MKNKISSLSHFVLNFTANPFRFLIHRVDRWLILGFVGSACLLFSSRAAVIEAWVQRYNGPASHSDIASGVAIDANGNVAVTGFSWNGLGYDYYTAKYAAANGALLWEKRYNGAGETSDQAQMVAVDSNGNVVVTGSSGTNTFDYYTAKYATADGALLWEKRYNGPVNDDDEAVAIAVDRSGNVVVTGYSVGIGSGIDYYTAKYAAANGQLLWEKRYNGPANGNDFAQAIALDANGNVAVTGSSATVKYAAGNGTVLWEKANAGAFGAAIAVDGSGNVIMAGYSGNGANLDFYTAKYAAGNGALLWEKRYNGPANSGDEAVAVAVDSVGNVVVTGYSQNGPPFEFGHLDYYTAKYAAANGQLLWEKRYNGPANDDDFAKAVAVDGNGNVIVTGYSFNGTNNDYYTASYAASDGALLWERRYNGPANKGDVIWSSHGLAVGSNGTIAITGTSGGDFGAVDFADYATVLYRENFPPVISCPSNMVVNCSGNGQAIVNFTVMITDDSGVAPTVSCAPPSGSAFPVGQTTVACTATDADMSSSTCSFTVTVADIAPPILNCPSNIIVEFTSEAGAGVTYSVAAVDTCDPAPVVICVPPSGQTLPIGATIIQCTASDANSNSVFCSFAVTVSGGRGTKENVLAELTALRLTLTNGIDRRQLDEAIDHLTRSLAANLWMDEAQLARKHGARVFHEEKLTVWKLCNLIKSRRSQVPDTILQGFIDRVFRVDRLLSAVAIQDAIAAGASSKRIEQAQRFLSGGDTAVADERCNNGIRAYRRAWRRAVH